MQRTLKLLKGSDGVDKLSKHRPGQSGYLRTRNLFPYLLLPSGGLWLENIAVTGHSRTSFSIPPDVVGALMGYLELLEINAATLFP